MFNATPSDVPGTITSAIVLIGIPASGKSTLAHSLMRSNPDYVCVSPDRIRGELYGDVAIQGEWLRIWSAVKAQVMSASQQSKSVIYDATNCQRKYRRAVIELLRSQHFQPITGILLQLPLWICLQRNQLRDRQVPEPVIIEMHRNLILNPPHLSEGFDRIFVQEDKPESEWID